MSDADRAPLGGGDFPEETRLRDGPMDREILVMAVEALNKQGHPDITLESAERDAAHRSLVIDMLRDCRPMPVVLDLIARLERA
jgi:hypothetical protein